MNIKSKMEVRMNNSWTSELTNHIENLDSAILEAWQKEYLEDNIVVMNNIVPDKFMEMFIREAQTLLEKHAERREVTISESGNTPRSYDSVGRDFIRNFGKLIPLLFDSEEFCDLLSEITGETLHPVPFLPEEFIINSQSKPNDTHGWHWDDYSYALIWCIDEPNPIHGARVEYIPNIKWEKKDTESYLIDVLRSNTVRSLHIKAGECYLMKADTCLHRVSPLTGSSKRTVVVMTYASTENLSDDSITHNSMEEIYPEEMQAEIAGNPE